MKTIEFDVNLSGNTGVINLPDEYKGLSGHVKVILKADENTDSQKEKILAALKKVQTMRIFEDIKDPVQWQRALRDEWE